MPSAWYGSRPRPESKAHEKVFGNRPYSPFVRGTYREPAGFIRAEQSVVEKMPCDIPGHQEVENILQGSYELFGIEERIFDSAVKDLNSSYKTLRNFEHNIFLEDREDPEL